MTNAERKRLSQHYALLFKHPLLLRGQCPFFEPACHLGKSSQGVLTVAGNVAITVALRMPLMVAIPIHRTVQVREGRNSRHLARTKEALVPFHSGKKHKTHPQVKNDNNIKTKQKIAIKKTKQKQTRYLRKCGKLSRRPDVKQHAAMYRNATDAYLAESDENQIKAHMTHAHGGQTDRRSD